MSEVLAMYALSIRLDRVSSLVSKNAKKHFLDTIACILGGFSSESTRAVSNYMSNRQYTSESSVLMPSMIKTDAEFAAFINGVSAHALDYDDVSTAMIGHPSAVVVPTALALGEALGSSGEEVLTAYIAGVEVCALLGLSLNPRDAVNGWHSTSTIGIFGASVAAARLIGLSLNQTVDALGIAGSEASGLRANTGTMVKSIHVGRAAQKGIFCAKLAECNIHASKLIFEAPFGIGCAMSNGFCEKALIDAIETGRSEFTSGTLVSKQWPVCYAAYNAVEAAITISEKNSIKWECIDHVLCRVSQSTRDMLPYDIPSEPLQGKFSLPYCIAAALRWQNISIEDFSDDRFSSLIGFLPRIKVETDKSLMNSAYLDGRDTTELLIVMKNRDKYFERVDSPRLSSNLLERNKIASCTGVDFSSQSLFSLENAVYNIENALSLSELLNSIMACFENIHYQEANL